MTSPKLTHIDDHGNAHMVDVSDKAVTDRTAIATGRVLMKPETLAIILEGRAKKGDVLGVARIAGIMAAKRTSDLVPLCHPLAITKVTVNLEPNEAESAIDVRALVKVSGQTGVEMEALTAVSVAALTIYDMCKSIDKSISISNIRLLKKSGGKSGTYLREENGQ
ncbi:MAG: cyclic pyranopterin monophosphate synthase MoaC [Henriciella sp.]|nr:cyclic pyranopterin monophosphate synthase MoaC [Henriciella sp.]